MSVLDKIFKRRQTMVKSLEQQTGTFTSFCGDAYSNDIYRGAVDAIARNIGKLKGSHFITYAEQDRREGDKKLNRMLQIRPNPYMSAYDFLYKLATHYFLYNNAFAFLSRDDRGNLIGIYPVTYTHVDMLADPSGRLFCQFTFKSGKRVTLPYSDLIHLRRNFNSDDLLGDNNQALNPALELAHTQNEGFISTIRAGAHIRGILQYNTIVTPNRMKQERDAFMRDYLQMDNDGGVIVMDQKATYTPVESKPVLLSAEQTEAIENKIFHYLGISKEIVNSSYTEDQFAAFYESTIEPFAVALSLEFTGKVFTEREQAYGNSIQFESGRLQFSNNATKVSLIKELMPMGLFTVNQALEILNLPSIPDGDKRLQTLNVVSADKAEQYQGVGDSGTEQETDKQEDGKQWN